MKHLTGSSAVVVSLLAVLTLSFIIASVRADIGELEVKWQQFLPAISGEEVIQTSDGGYLMLGTNASVEGTPPVYVNYESVLVRTDLSGDVMWTKTYLIDDLSPELSGLIETADGGYALGGELNGDAILLKFDSQGDIQWSKHFPGSYNDITNEYAFDFGSFIQTSDGGYIFAGSYPQPGTYPYNIGVLLLLKVDALGNLQWNRTFASYLYSGFHASDILQTVEDGYIIIGTQFSRASNPSFFAIMKTDSNGNVQWYKTYGGEDNYFHTGCWKGIATADGGYLLAGHARRLGGGAIGEHGWFVKVDSSGNMLWNRTVETQATQIMSIVQANSNEYVFAGAITTYTAWVGKIDNTGNLGDEVKITAKDPYDNISPNSIVLASNGSYVFVGKWDNTSGATNSRMWLVKIASSNLTPSPTIEFPLWAILPLIFALAVVVLAAVKLSSKKLRRTKRSVSLGVQSRLIRSVNLLVVR